MYTEGKGTIRRFALGGGVLTHTRRDWIIGVGSLGLASLLPAAQAPDWPQFRGPDRDNISSETGLLRQWPAGGPKVLWTVPVAQGYAGAAIVGGRVYHHDYDEAKSEWCVNCRYSGRRQGDLAVSRSAARSAPTTPSPAPSRRWTAASSSRWTRRRAALPGRQDRQADLAQEPGHRIQDHHSALVQRPVPAAWRRTASIIATGGAAIMVALDKATGKEIWRTPNPGKLLLSHASVMPAVLGGVKQYLYGTLERTAGRLRQRRKAAVGVPAQVQRGGGALAARAWTGSGSS